MKKRILSLILATALCLSLLPAAALALEEAEASNPELRAETLPEEPVPAGEEPIAEQPAAEEPSAEGEEPAAEEPSGEEPEAEQPEAEEPSGEAAAEEEGEEASEEPEGSEEPAPVTNADGVFRFRRTFAASDVAEKYHYEDAYFAGSSWSYDHGLARLSLAAALAAAEIPERVLPASQVEEYNYHGAPLDLTGTAAGNIAAMLGECGFTDVMANGTYLISTAYDGGADSGLGLGVCLGRKTLSDGTTLLAVAARGEGYGSEWIGNFEICDPEAGPYHRGFALAAEVVTDAIGAYVSELGVTGPVKVWLSGYSRGAAAVNLAAASLCRSGLSGCELSPEGVYAYTFETPMGTKTGDADAAIYNGIYNIVNPIDPVPYVLMAQWGYARYGRTLYLPCAERDASLYAAWEPQVLARYNGYRGVLGAALPMMPGQTYYLGRMVGELSDALNGDSSRRTRLFQSTVQTYLRTAYRGSGSGGGRDLLSGLLTAAFRAAVGDSETFQTLTDNLGTVMQGHYPELSLAWLYSVPASALTESAGVYCALAPDGSAAVVIGDPGGLYARASLVVESAGQTGLFVAQAAIGSDSRIALPPLAVPGLTVRGVNVALVRTLDDISSPTPSVEAVSYMDL